LSERAENTAGISWRCLTSEYRTRSGAKYILISSTLVYFVYPDVS